MAPSSIWANFYMTLKNKVRDHILKIRFRLGNLLGKCLF